MPIIRSAKKKMRQDKKRTQLNEAKKTVLRGMLKNMRREPSVQLLSEVMSKLDKAAKTHLIHPNKAARLKSRLSKQLAVSTKPTK